MTGERMMDQAAERGEALAAPAGQFFIGDGEMATLMRATDWSQTPLGPVETWSPSLRMIVRILLSNRFPMLLWWGPEFLQLYNDAYRPVLGTKHPQYLGRSARECWAEIWDVIGPLIETPFNGGPPTWSDDIFLEINRYGFIEETHFTIAYSPVPDESAPNGIGGVLATVHEISDKVVADRRVLALRDLGARAAEAKSAEEACQIACETLAGYAKDIPFALLYLIDPDGEHARLAATAGIEQPDHPLGPPVIALGAEAGVESGAGEGVAAGVGEGAAWPLTDVRRTEMIRVVDHLAARFGAVPSGPWSDAPDSAVVTPIRSTIAHQLAGFMVAGVSPRLRYDDTYAGFYDLVSSQIASAIANARAYEEERKRAEALAAIDRAKTAFFSNVSHEFGTPLSLMLGPLEDLRERQDGLPPAARESLDVMRRNGLRLLKLVNTLLDFSRIEAGRVRASYEPTDLAAFTTELASAFRSLVEQAGMALVVDCPPLDGALAEPVYVDREMWEKIVFNLLSNAFKFTFEGAISVTLRAVDDGRAVELVVRDTGVGIPEAEMSRLFERFHRIEGARSRTHEGSGIGLALIQELTHLHGGAIRAESQEGVGAAFFVRLPVGATHLPADRIRAGRDLASMALGTTPFIEEAARWLPDTLEPIAVDAERLPPTALAEPSGAAIAPLPSARILLADDNADMRDYLRRLLSERYTVQVAANGARALAAITADPHRLPDLVIADVMMPELDGIELVRALRANPTTASLPIILLSARAGEEATAEGLESGADDYLVKPFSAREVLARVAARLEIARTRSQAEQRLSQSLDALMSMAEALAPAPEEPGEEPGGEPGAERSAPGVQGVIHQVLGLIQRVLDGQYAGASYIASETGAFEPIATAGLSQENEQRLWRDVSHRRVSDYYPPDTLDLLNAEEIVAFNFVVEPPIGGQDYYGLRNVLIAPVRMDDQRLLVIAVEARGRPTFTAHERGLAQAAARLVRLVIERGRLLREREEGRLRELSLTEAKRRMDEFLGIASHELRTPLTSITANVQLASRQLTGLSQQVAALDGHAGAHEAGARLERSELLLARTERQMGRLDRLVGDLLDISRIQAGKLKMRPESCDLLEIVREAASEQRAAWPGRSIELDLPRHAAVWAIADADRVGQVVTNFLTNALKYSARDQPVAVRVRRHGALARVEVSDHGPGLTVSQRAQLFERFYRAPGIEQQSGSGVGLGLGLYICKTIIERHGGVVGVESAPGKGSTFWFTLPLSGAEPDDGKRLPQRSARARSPDD